MAERRGGSGGREEGAGSPVSVAGVGGGRGGSGDLGEGLASLASASSGQMAWDQPVASGSWGRGPPWTHRGARD